MKKETITVLSLGLGILIIFGVAILIHYIGYIYSGDTELCEERGYSYIDCPRGELKCQDACKEFNLEFYKHKNSCWCLYEELPKRIY